MSVAGALADDTLNDLIDDRLDRDELAQVKAVLAGSPALAARVAAMRRQHRALQGLGREILDEPVPERLRRVLRRAEPRRPHHHRALRRGFGLLGATGAYLLS